MKGAQAPGRSISDTQNTLLYAPVLPNSSHTGIQNNTLHEHVLKENSVVMSFEDNIAGKNNRSLKSKADWV